MATKFRGWLVSRDLGLGSTNRANIYNRNGAGQYAFGEGTGFDLDSTQVFFQNSKGPHTILQFAVDTGETLLGQSNFGTLSSTGGIPGLQGCFELKFANGRRFIYICVDGWGFYNGTDKLFFTLITLPPFGP